MRYRAAEPAYLTRTLKVKHSVVQTEKVGALAMMAAYASVHAHVLPSLMRNAG